MAKLEVLDRIALGEFIINAVLEDGETRALLLKDPTEALRKFVKIPPDKVVNGQTIKHTIVLHPDEEHVTHVILPWIQNIKNAMQDIEKQTQIYPSEYRPDHPGYINDAKEPKKALFFRFGEYMFSRCR